MSVKNFILAALVVVWISGKPCNANQDQIESPAEVIYGFSSGVKINFGVNLGKIHTIKLSVGSRTAEVPLNICRKLAGARHGSVSLILTAGKRAEESKYITIQLERDQSHSSKNIQLIFENMVFRTAVSVEKTGDGGEIREDF